MYQNVNNPQIPLLNVHLKGLKMGFMDYLNRLISIDE
jgi:hypothetical protein